MLKLLQLQPEKEIIVEFIKNEDYKYVRVLGKFQLLPSYSLDQCGSHLVSASSRLEPARYLALPRFILANVQSHYCAFQAHST